MLLKPLREAEKGLMDVVLLLVKDIANPLDLSSALQAKFFISAIEIAEAIYIVEDLKILSKKNIQVRFYIKV